MSETLMSHSLTKDYENPPPLNPHPALPHRGGGEKKGIIRALPRGEGKYDGTPIIPPPLMGGGEGEGERRVFLGETTKSLRRIGLFGGTFNPIHSGHLRIADEIRRHFSLDSIIFIPTGIPPHKEKGDVIEPIHRLRMVDLAIRPYKNFAVSSIEVDRHDFSYSIDTVNALQREMGDTTELYFIVGIDAFLDIRTWKDADELLTLCNFIVIPRHGHRFTELKGIDLPPLYNVPVTDLESLDSGRISSLSVQLTGRYSLFLQQITPCDISSTELRRLIREGKEVKNQLPESVLLYIMNKKLYK